MQGEPLDAPEKNGEQYDKPARFVRYLRNAEIIALAMWLYGYIGMSLFPFGLRAFGAGALILLFIYLFLPGVIMGARGWKQQLVAYFAGLMLVAVLVSILFAFESWEGATLGRQIAFSGAGLLLLGSIIFLVGRKRELQQQSFAYMVLIRMFMVVVFTISNGGLMILSL